MAYLISCCSFVKALRSLFSFDNNNVALKTTFASQHFEIISLLLVFAFKIPTNISQLVFEVILRTSWCSV